MSCAPAGSSLPGRAPLSSRCAVPLITPLALPAAPNTDRLSAYWRAALCRAGYGATGASVEPLADLAGALATLRVPLPSPWPSAAYLMAWPGGQVLVLINGTTVPQQYVAAVAGGLPAALPPWAGLVHLYFGFAAAAVWAAVSPVLAALAPTQVSYLGHSLGGAVAQLLATRPQPWPLGYCWTMGQPRVGTAAWAATLTVPAERWTAAGDPVPLLPPARDPLIDATFLPDWPIPPLSFAHVGRRLHLAPSGLISEPGEAGSWQEGTTALLASLQAGTAWADAHASDAYACRLRAGLPVKWAVPLVDWPQVAPVDVILRDLGTVCPVILGPTQTSAPDFPPASDRIAKEGVCR
jgi:pimeloyl-ACP methyl ester carboxylesterase